MARIFTIFILLSSLYNLNAQNRQIVNIEMKNVDIKDILRKIEQQTSYSFVYNETINLDIKKSVSIEKKSIDAALHIIFSKTNIDWKISNNHILLSKHKEIKNNVITISGYITDEKSAETLIGASIADKKSGVGNFSNNYGYYTVNIPSGQIEIQVSYIGFTSISKNINLQRDTIINFGLNPGHQLSEVVVTPQNNFSPSGSSIELSGINIKSMPAAFGESDVLKSLQYVPGVQSGVEGSAGIYVRGGGADQNLILLDGIPIYNTGHVYGLFSIFNGDAVKKVSLHKGSFPARFGGRLSSVIDIRLRDGDMYNYNGAFSIGLLSSSFNFGGPIIKGKTAFNISARRSYLDAFTRIVQKFTDDAVPIFYIYDLNAKINHKFSDRSRLFLSIYNGKDKVGSESESSRTSYFNGTNIHYSWGNIVSSLRWNYVFSNKLFANSTLAYNNYKFDYRSSQENRSEISNNYTEIFQSSGIKDWSINTDFEYSPTDKHRIRFGGGGIFHKFNPEVHGSRLRETEDGEEIINEVNHFLDDKIIAREASLYLEDEFPINNHFKTNIGIHFSVFNVQNKTYNLVQPRISFGYEVSNKLSMRASYTKMNQYINLLTSNALSMPTDLWVPITKNLKPMEANQFTFGVYYDTDKDYKISVEGFYKKMNNVLEYKDGASWKDTYSSWENQVEAGQGWAYGAEFFAQKTIGKLTGWIGYTLAWNDRKFETINRGERFRAKYDRRHDISTTLLYTVNKKIDMSASWMFASGNNATLPVEEYQQLPRPNTDDMWDYNPSQPIFHVEKRNNYRLPVTHHLDLNLNYYRTDRKIWSFTIYNVYNRANPYVVYPGFSEKEEKKGRNILVQYSLLRIVPSVTFTYKFK